MMLLHASVSRQATLRPSSVAIVDGEDRTTYQELDAESNRLANALLDRGLHRGDRVSIMMPKSARTIISMLGVLKAGGIYVPIDTQSPSSRLSKIIEKCRPAFILANRSTGRLVGEVLKLARHGVPGKEIIGTGWMDGEPATGDHAAGAFTWDQVSRYSTAAPAVISNSEDVAHILFTSGSSGAPKGVMITHENVGAFIEWAVKYFEINESDRVSGHPPLHFDLSTFDIYGTFLAGAELHLVPPETSLLPKTLAAFIREHNLTQWFSVPSAMRYMAQCDVISAGDFPSLKRVLWCGEALPVPTLIYWMERLPHASFTNLYGPTEATIAKSYYRVPTIPMNDVTDIPIGAPCEGDKLYVLDEGLHPVPPGHVGDLYIAGKGLSPGYWEDEEQTASVFVHRNGERIYKTGDLAKIDDEGMIHFLGRGDSQIKRAGYRIELGEVEAALNQLPQVKESVVVAVPSETFDGMAICCAYVAADCDLPPATVRQQLSAHIPTYMLPNRWLRLEELPLNGNSKINRREVAGLFTAQMPV